MVTRKPVGPPLATSHPTVAAALPYPTTPVQESAKSTASSNSIYSADLAKSPAFDLIDVGKAQERRDSDASSHGTWNSDDTEEQDHDTPEEVEVPKPLNIRNSQDMTGAAGKSGNKVLLPESLRVGPPSGYPRRTSQEGQRYEDEAQANPWAESAAPRPVVNGRTDSNKSKNPYVQRGAIAADNSQSEWQEVKPPALPSMPPPAVPAAAPPMPPSFPYQPAFELSAVASPPASESTSQWLSEVPSQDHRPASWETAEILTVPQRGQAPLPPPSQDANWQDNRPVSTWWHDSVPTTSASSESHTPVPPYPVDSRPQSQYDPPPGPPPSRTNNLIDFQDRPKPPPQGVAPIDTSRAAANSSSASVPETLQKQRNQTYQIKHVNWLQPPAPGQSGGPSTRRSPILTQNANGPCPLLALVNALVLSTPANLDTQLIETLRTREQVSLGLLLDAVFEELMSGRRDDSTAALPDVHDLYSFLLALHTGMNVNPRFVTPIETPRGSLEGRPTSWNSVHPAQRAQRKAGAFEETREMRLYSTFNVPLIHGWTAPADTPAYDAFLRSAPTFEDAQNIQFLEAELEDKMRSEGLPPQEQQTLQDIQTIKAFLAAWPTQLTDFGLQTIAESLTPGQFAILFRNDHFSTIYKEPQHGALMTLVTDAGYSSHDEIVWESLVDVNGAGVELFSGDFRVVSHNQDVRLNQGNPAGDNAGWETVQSRNRSKAKQEDAPPLPGPRPNVGPSTSGFASDDLAEIPDPVALRQASEQEDHDLALALQLQEEEEEQQRQLEQQRKREQELSEQFLSNESEGPRPAVPPRRNGGRAGAGPTTAPGSRSTAPSIRPAVSRPSDNPADPEAPPSYEQAASEPPYRPAGSTAPATMAQGNPLGAYDALRRQHSPYSPQSPGSSQPPVVQNRRRSDARMGRRQSSMQNPPIPGSYQQVQAQAQGQRVNQAAGVKEAEDRCVVM